MLQGDIDNGQEQRRRCGKNQENVGAEAFKRADEREGSTYGQRTAKSCSRSLWNVKPDRTFCAP